MIEYRKPQPNRIEITEGDKKVNDVVYKDGSIYKVTGLGKVFQKNFYSYKLEDLGKGPELLNRQYAYLESMDREEMIARKEEIMTLLPKKS